MEKNTIPKHMIYEGVSKSFRTESITKYMLTAINTRWEATRGVMAAKLTRLTHKIAIQLHPVAESCTICRSRSRRPVRKLLDTPSYENKPLSRRDPGHLKITWRYQLFRNRELGLILHSSWWWSWWPHRMECKRCLIQPGGGGGQRHT
jgi:hypothetical protein